MVKFTILLYKDNKEFETVMLVFHIEWVREKREIHDIFTIEIIYSYKHIISQTTR